MREREERRVEEKERKREMMTTAEKGGEYREAEKARE